MPFESVTTDRLILRRPLHDDAAALYRICADPAVWRHYPSKVFTEAAQAERMVADRIALWERDGLAAWTALDRDSEAVIGYGGVAKQASSFWNLGYRLDAAVHGRGLARELAEAAVRAAAAHSPQLPVVAYLLENNAASAAVAVRAGLSLRHRGPDRGNPDPDAVRLVYADRVLSPEVLADIMEA